jgi:malate dehydrogenase (oxaloacetate-decarboxylating)
MDINQQALDLHKKYSGKITTKLRDGGKIDRQKLSAYYSPGVAAVCQEIANDETRLREYTWTNNLVAVISDGSAVLGLGDIGPKASLPVMEGKALLFKHFADIDSIPIVLDVHTPDEIVETITTKSFKLTPTINFFLPKMREFSTLWVKTLPTIEFLASFF